MLHLTTDSQVADLLLANNHPRAPSLLLTPRGCRIYTTEVGGGYNFTSGTSIAAPFVSGAAALLQAVAQVRSTAGVMAAECT